MSEYVAAHANAKTQREAEQTTGTAGSSQRPPNNNAGGSLDIGGEELTWERVQDEFLGRVQLDLMQREVSRAAILRKMQHECSFAPTISSKAKRVRGGSQEKLMFACQVIALTRLPSCLCSWTWAPLTIDCEKTSRSGRRAKSRCVGGLAATRWLGSDVTWCSVYCSTRCWQDG